MLLFASEPGRRNTFNDDFMVLSYHSSVTSSASEFAVQPVLFAKMSMLPTMSLAFSINALDFHDFRNISLDNLRASTETFNPRAGLPGCLAGTRRLLDRFPSTHCHNWNLVVHPKARVVGHSCLQQSTTSAFESKNALRQWARLVQSALGFIETAQCGNVCPTLDAVFESPICACVGFPRRRRSRGSWK